MAPIDNPIIWVHGDCLNPHSPAFQKFPNAPAIWVWDDAYLQRGRFSLKRILFIYECLLELPVAIHRGDVVQELVKFAHANHTETIVTMDSPSSGFAKICRQLHAQGLQLQIYETEPFVTLPKPIDLRRFSRYWRVVKTVL